MRYIALKQPPKATWQEDRPVTVDSSMTIYEADDTPLDTGLLNADGTRLYKVPDQKKIGYL